MIVAVSLETIGDIIMMMTFELTADAVQKSFVRSLEVAEGAGMSLLVLMIDVEKIFEGFLRGHLRRAPSSLGDRRRRHLLSGPRLGTRTHARTHALTHGCMHARMHARTHAVMPASMHAHDSCKPCTPTNGVPRMQANTLQAAQDVSPPPRPPSPPPS